MKKFFHGYTSWLGMILVMLVYLSSCGKLDKIDGMEAALNTTSSSRSSQCELIITGRVVNTKNLEPIADAMVESSQFSARTDENGQFSTTLTIEEDGIVDDVTITKGGFVIKSFKAYYGSLVTVGTCPAVTNISWDIGLSELKEDVWVGPKDGAWYKIMDTVATEFTNALGLLDTALITNVYTIDIRRGSFNDWKNVIISPDNSRAVGPGIPIEVSNFVIVHFDIQVNDSENGLQQVASSRNEEVFLKDLDIRFPLPSAVSPHDYSVIDLADLGIDGSGINLDGQGNIIYFETEDGQFCIVYNPLLLEVVQPALEAIANGSSLEEINEIINDGLTSLAEMGEGNGLGGGSTMVDTDVERDGRIANREVFSNCQCGNPTSQSYTASLDGLEDITIGFPAGTSPQQQALAFTTLRALLGVSGEPNQAVALSVELDKCSTAEVISKEIVRTVTGTVLGFPFSYTGTDRLETTVTNDSCPTDTPCHQGCPG